MLGTGTTELLAYVLVYAVAIVGCSAALRRAVVIDDDETRRGLVGLLVSSGGWAAAQLAYLLAPPAYQYALYLAGLIVGLTTVGAWLYFASAYTGRAFHRTPAYRRAAVGTYLAIVAVKLTNPVHELYFTAERVATPFVHLAIQQGMAHWVVTGLSYALVTVGFFMLFEQFLEADFDTRPLAALVGVTALPVAFDVVEIASASLLDLSLEPVGVAAFAVGTLYAFDDRFLSVQLSDGVDDGLVYLDEDDRLRSLLLSAFRFAVHNEATRVTVRLTDDGLTVADDGREHSALDPESFFEYGGAVPDAEAGIALPNVRTLARVHGWSATVDGDYEGGVKLVIEDACAEPDPAPKGGDSAPGGAAASRAR
ncbi:histidine kinase N-terminal 7TM domain-containing protein [Halobaculum gomorrense]|uniref:N-terminal 7TM region of histidine kinase n=1 Tax=Halobaculum gomorrense TaxID=43928 RepID=A0A1M5K2U7_9EURY|nr:histidine kinase N-terminal 7TM domain-containing protein [Halobaculum gomorrense]SHG47086.1 N-terminal 7TM region of histidine kinase [Halobaculum gomorrense]